MRVVFANLSQRLTEGERWVAMSLQGTGEQAGDYSCTASAQVTHCW
jgi:hypothetical protein